MYGDHLVNHIKHPELNSNNTLHVIGVVSNTVRYHSRPRLFREWLARMEVTPNVKVYIVEMAFGDRKFEFTEPDNPSHLQLRSSSSIWVKECMINLAVKRLLPKDWKYVCWSDTDIAWRDPNWAQETMHQLQHFQVVQPWSDALDLGPNGDVLQHFRSFGRQHQLRIPKQMWPAQPYQYAHTGYAVAATRLFWENTGGLPDFCILGSADHHLLFGCIGRIKETIHGKMSPSFFRRLIEWQSRAMKVTKGEVGYVTGRLEHFWHGSKKRRYYRERWTILYEHKYCPDIDLMYDAQGLIQLIGKPALDHETHQYSLSRQEDDISNS